MDYFNSVYFWVSLKLKYNENKIKIVLIFMAIVFNWKNFYSDGQIKDIWIA